MAPIINSRLAVALVVIALLACNGGVVGQDFTVGPVQYEDEGPRPSLDQGLVSVDGQSLETVVPEGFTTAPLGFCHESCYRGIRVSCSVANSTKILLLNRWRGAATGRTFSVLSTGCNTTFCDYTIKYSFPTIALRSSYQDSFEKLQLEYNTTFNGTSVPQSALPFPKDSNCSALAPPPPSPPAPPISSIPLGFCRQSCYRGLLVSCAAANTTKITLLNRWRASAAGNTFSILFSACATGPCDYTIKYSFTTNASRNDYQNNFEKRQLEYNTTFLGYSVADASLPFPKDSLCSPSPPPAPPARSPPPPVARSPPPPVARSPPPPARFCHLSCYSGLRVTCSIANSTKILLLNRWNATAPTNNYRVVSSACGTTTPAPGCQYTIVYSFPTNATRNSYQNNFEKLQTEYTAVFQGTSVNVTVPKDYLC